jgi:hypothetical protein
MNGMPCTCMNVFYDKLWLMLIFERPSALSFFLLFVQKLQESFKELYYTYVYKEKAKTARLKRKKNFIRAFPFFIPIAHTYSTIWDPSAVKTDDPIE